MKTKTKTKTKKTLSIENSFFYLEYAKQFREIFDDELKNYINDDGFDLDSFVLKKVKQTNVSPIDDISTQYGREARRLIFNMMGFSTS